MRKEKLAIIGNGMATGRLLDEMFRRDKNPPFEITVFGEEPHGCYNRILLNQVLLGGDMDDITIKTKSWYADKGVTLLTGRKVTSLSPAAHRLWTSDGLEHYFDKAVFATGSAPRLPMAEGFQDKSGNWKEGIATYRNAADCERIRARVRPGGQAVVIGGGLLGIEAAKGLHDLGMNVTIVHLFDILMNRQLDLPGARLLRTALERMGITVRTSVNTKSFEGTSQVEAVRLADGTRLPADVVVLASGVKPRIDLARESDILTNAGIHVDDRLQSSVEGIFAVGECAEHRNRIYGTVQPVYDQCGVLADVLCGTNPSTRYRGSKVYTRLKVVGIDLASMGEIDSDSEDDEILQIFEEKKGIYRKLVIRDGRLIGAVLLGDTRLAGDLVGRLERGDPLPKNRLDLFASDDLSPQAVNPVVCNCTQVTESTLQTACNEGCRTLADIAERTGAGTGCGSCRGRISALLLKANRQPAVPMKV